VPRTQEAEKPTGRKKAGERGYSSACILLPIVAKADSQDVQHFFRPVNPAYPVILSLKAADGF